MTFAAPVAISANTTYVASYHTNVGFYASDNSFFASAGVDAPPLHAPADGAAGGNGVYAYGAGGFPAFTFSATNYWVDVVFDTTSGDTIPAHRDGTDAGSRRDRRGRLQPGDGNVQRTDAARDGERCA